MSLTEESYMTRQNQVYFLLKEKKLDPDPFVSQNSLLIIYLDFGVNQVKDCAKMQKNFSKIIACCPILKHHHCKHTMHEKDISPWSIWLEDCFPLVVEVDL